MISPENIKTLCLVLTSQCNLRCSYCFENAKKSGTMPWETVRASVDLALRTSHDTVKIVFFGGEPLLEFDLMKRAVRYAEENNPEGKRLRYGISTNGTLLDDQKADFLVGRWFDTQLSFDGVPEAQAFRGNGTFAKLDVLLDRLRTRHRAFFRWNLTVSVTLLPQTIPHLAGSIGYFLGKGVQKIEITPSNTSEAFWKKEMIHALDDAFEGIYGTSRDHYLGTGEIPFQLFQTPSSDPKPGPRGRTMCGVMRGETPTVDVDGQVLGCATFADSFQVFPSEFLKSRLDAMKIGKLGDADLEEKYTRFPDAVRRAGMFHSKQLKYSSYLRCSECRHFDSCSVCPVSIGNIPGNTNPHRIPDFLCAYNLISLFHRDRFATGVQTGFAEDRRRGKLYEYQGLVSEA